MRQRDWIAYGTPAASEKRGVFGEKERNLSLPCGRLASLT